MSIAWCSYLHKSIGRHDTMGIRKFLCATVVLLLSFSALAAGPQRSKEKDKDKDRGQTPVYTGAQCSPGTGGQGASAQGTTPVPVEEMVRRFAQHESEFRLARDNYTYTQEVLVEDIAPNRGE